MNGEDRREPTLEEAVSASVPTQPHAGAVSTADALQKVRQLLPADDHSDEEIVIMIAEVAVSRFLAVRFDDGERG